MSARYELEITISSARNLKNISWRHGSLNPYAVVWVDPKKQTHNNVDEVGDESPVWDEKLTISRIQLSISTSCTLTLRLTPSS
ncbi:putative C2 domain-containing protein [Helianthus annuus]|uniref:C2 domain-containing protein n=1 Tax=Helianthus annuus TaxID=4232 RepID=A0A9K3IUJ9_HELAN|nr:putative C2 domain-containing protein [Helianthus annuus]KAJ0574080.1 putative C2 domain-containing protein [Helianthus annuus]KAJ0738415.1 putative C2 domain-containing protein [Helianthus annuus]KAJ0741303.1 putative C2 domain-containing protein [Helianthus annuus]KAJ0912530.1 putative C2 domain-containing protein [Helianthus annuus]